MLSDRLLKKSADAGFRKLNRKTTIGVCFFCNSYINDPAPLAVPSWVTDAVILTAEITTTIGEVGCAAHVFYGVAFVVAKIITPMKQSGHTPNIAYEDGHSGVKITTPCM